MHTTLVLLVHHGKLVRVLEGRAHLHHVYIGGDVLLDRAGLEGADGQGHPD